LLAEEAPPLVAGPNGHEPAGGAAGTRVAALFAAASEPPPATDAPPERAPDPGFDDLLSGLSLPAPGEAATEAPAVPALPEDLPNWLAEEDEPATHDGTPRPPVAPLPAVPLAIDEEPAPWDQPDGLSMVGIALARSGRAALSTLPAPVLGAPAPPAALAATFAKVIAGPQLPLAPAAQTAQQTPARPARRPDRAFRRILLLLVLVALVAVAVLLVREGRLPLPAPLRELPFLDSLLFSDAASLAPYC
jgi:hypothetical protein